MVSSSFYDLGPNSLGETYSHSLADFYRKFNVMCFHDTTICFTTQVTFLILMVEQIIIIIIIITWYIYVLV